MTFTTKIDKVAKKAAKKAAAKKVVLRKVTPNLSATEKVATETMRKKGLTLSPFTSESFDNLAIIKASQHKEVKALPTFTGIQIWQVPFKSPHTELKNEKDLPDIFRVKVVTWEREFMVDRTNGNSFIAEVK